jgi:formylmethanofuran dehydrogenase subunit E
MPDLPDELAALKRFHGHLGPFAVIGYRMGLIARRRFPQRIYAVLHSGTQRPLSCLADGVQMSSCCTLGKGNIALREDGEAVGEFSDGAGHLLIALRPEVRARIEAETTHATEEIISLDLHRSDEAALFTVTEGRGTPFGR